MTESVSIVKLTNLPDRRQIENPIIMRKLPYESTLKKMNKTYLEIGKDYRLFIDFEKSEVSIEGNFLGEERSVRNQKGELWNRTLDYLTQKGTKFYEETILRDAISGVESKPDLGSEVEAETGVSNPFQLP